MAITKSNVLEEGLTRRDRATLVFKDFLWVAVDASLSYDLFNGQTSRFTIRASIML